MKTALLACVVLVGCSKGDAPRVPPAAVATDVPVEQAGVIRRGDEPLTLVGAPLAVGDTVPAVSLMNSELAPVELAAFRGKLVVLSVVPSIDTRVCESQTHHVSDAIAQLPAGTEVITVSRDLPFAQTRFKESAMTQTAMLSDYKGGAFGRAFGLDVKESGLLARSVWVIGRDGRVSYREIVADQTQEPDYDALLAAAAAAR